MYLYVFIVRLPPALDGSGGYAYNEEEARAELTAAHPERTRSRQRSFVEDKRVNIPPAPEAAQTAAQKQQTTQHITKSAENACRDHRRQFLIYRQEG